MRRVIAVPLLILAVAIGGGLWYLTQPQRVARHASDLLETMSGAEVAIESAHVGWDGVIDLRGVELSVPGLKGEGARLFTADQILMRVDLFEAATGDFVAEQMIIRNPILRPTKLNETTFNYEVLQKLRAQQRNESGGIKLPKLPRIFVEGGRIRHGEVYEGKYTSFESRPLSGRLTPLAEVKSIYDFEMAMRREADASPDATPMRVAGRFDLEKLTVEWKMSDFAFADPARNMLPQQIRDWWDKFNPSGSLPEVEFSYDEATGPKGMVRVENVALSLPPEWVVRDEATTDAAAPSGPVYEPRMTGVSGTFRFDSDRVYINGLVGEIEGLVYKIEGEIGGYAKDSPFRIRLETLPFQVPEEPRYMIALPVPVQKIFSKLNPAGWMRVSGELRRDETGGELDYNGTAIVLSGRPLIDALRDAGQITGRIDPADPKWDSRGFYHKFPYPLRQCRGLLTFSNEAIEVKHLTGETPGGGTATITGSIGPPSAGTNAAVDVTVTAVDIPFDETLRQSLPEKQRAALDLFFDKPAWQRLLERGRFVTEARNAADTVYRDQVAADLDKLRKTDAVHPDVLAEKVAEFERADAKLGDPMFDLGGRGDVVVKVTRPVGPGLKPTLNTAIDIKQANVIFKFFPYPIRVSGGRLVISPGVATFDQIKIVGLTGGRGIIDGHIDLPSKGSGNPIVPRLKLTAADVPFDNTLYDTLPDPQDRWLRELNLTGRFDLAGTIHHDETTGKIGVDMALNLASVAATPGGGDFTIAEIAGVVRIGVGKLTVEKLTGGRKDARITLSGEADWSDRERPTMRFAAEAEGLRFDDPVLDLVGPAIPRDAQVRTFWSERQPEGTFAAAASYSKLGDEPPVHRVDIRPDALSFLHRGNRVGLVNVTGAIVVEPERVTLKEIAGLYDGGSLNLNGTVERDEALTTRVSFKAVGERITAGARRVLPAAIGRMIDGLELMGAYELDVSELELRPGAKSGRAYKLSAAAYLTEASASLGVPITGADMNIAIEATGQVGAEWPRVDVTVDAKKLLAAGRPVEDLRVRMRNTEPSERFVIPELAGRAGGGRMTGSGAIAIGRGDFQLRLELSDANLATLVAPDGVAKTKPDDAKANDPDALTGSVSASIAVEGNLHKRDELRGRGDLRVLDGNLYGVPLALGLLRVAHLTLPVDDHFHSANISYFLQDRSVRLEHLQLHSKSMQLDGGGTFDLEAGTVDIALTTSNPSGLKLGPLTELIDKLRDQLVTIRVTGSLDDPKTKVEQFSGISNAFKDVVGGTEVSD